MGITKCNSSIRSLVRHLIELVVPLQNVRAQVPISAEVTGKWLRMHAGVDHLRTCENIERIQGVGI
jgi:hypothetical protein